MNRSDEIHVAVGGILLGVGGLGLTILIPLAAAVEPQQWTAIWFLAPCGVAGAFLISGLYMVAAVYAGFPLPPTAAERTFAPQLGAVEAHVINIADGDVVFQIGFNNSGRGDVTNALVNVVAPGFVTSFHRCHENGTLRTTDGAYSTTPESLVDDDQGRPLPSIYWNGNIDFPGRTHRVVFFRARMSALRHFPIRYEVTSAALPEPLEGRFQLVVPSA